MAFAGKTGGGAGGAEELDEAAGGWAEVVVAPVDFPLSQGRQASAMTMASRTTPRAAVASSHRRRELLTAGRRGGSPAAGA